MTKSQLNKLLEESNDIFDYTGYFGFHRIVTHYCRDTNMTTLYDICYEDHDSGYEPKTIELLVKFHGRRIMTFAPMERIVEDK